MAAFEGSAISSNVIRRLAHYKRCLSTQSMPVKLAFEHYPAQDESNSPRSPLIMVHGLYGSKQNWRSIAKNLARSMQRSVWTVDLRNHGESPHATPVTYTAMAEDLAHFVKSNSLQNAILLGHSLGGKVVMTLALDPTYRELLSKLIVVDMSPAKGPISKEFTNYIQAMRAVGEEIQKGTITTKKEADVRLQAVEPNLGTRQFLLTNLVPRSSNDHTLHWRINVDNLANGLDEIGKFPFEPSDIPEFDKPVLFIKGAQSKYINRKSLEVAKQYFPNLKLETLETGHWVHAEKPTEFQELVKDFCKE